LKNNQNVLVLALLAAFLAMAWFGDTQMQGLQRPDYSSFSTNNYGASLLFDTLRQMQYPVSQLFRPVSEAGTNDVVLIIQPQRLDFALAEEAIQWVRQGGRLIFLDNRRFTPIDVLLEHYQPDIMGNFRLYSVGMGEILVGRADAVANQRMMNNPTYGAGISYLLYAWNPDRIYFAEYYHGFRVRNSAFRQMPLGLQLTAYQLAIVALALVWHLGKRFGKPIPLYEEIEREEHEQIYVLARLYRWADKRRK